MESEGRNGGVAQLGEHLPCKQGVMSSNLTISTMIMKRISRHLNKTDESACAIESGCDQMKGHSKNGRDERNEV